ncbi:MAG: YqgE/AlgH family protein [Planctomycetales bacterium]|nr:YqgE/AlgH family protein [Planctomycetales bacterium]
MQDTNPNPHNESMIGKLLIASTTVQDPILSRSVCLVVHQDTENVFAVLLNRPMTPPPGLAKLLDSAGQSKTGAVGNQVDTLNDNHSKRSLNSVPNSYPTNLPAKNAKPQQPDGPTINGLQSPDGELTNAIDNGVGKGVNGNTEQTFAEASKSLGTIHFGGPLSGPVVAVHNSSEHAEAQAGKGVYVAAQRELLETLVQQKPGHFRLIVGHLGWSLDQLRSERAAGFWHMIDATDEDVFTGDQDLWPSVIRRATTASVADWLKIRNTPFAGELN